MISDEELIRLALEEDIGPGDVTTDALIGPEEAAEGVIVAKEPLVLAGLGLAHQVFTTLDEDIRFESPFEDGAQVEKGTQVAGMSGRLRPLLMGE